MGSGILYYCTTDQRGEYPGEMSEGEMSVRVTYLYANAEFGLLQCDGFIHSFASSFVRSFIHLVIN